MGAVQSDPWMAAMHAGDFETAWKISDRVLAERRRTAVDCSSWPRHLQFLWNGASYDGKHVLVRCYHGLGDTIQFVRFLEPLRRRAHRVTLWAQPALLDLLRQVRGIDRLLALNEGSPDVECEVEMESMEVAHALRIDASQLAARSPYIEVEPLGQRVVNSSAFNVGIAWRSGAWNASRSMPREALQPLTQVQGVRLHALQFPPEPLPFAAGQLACASIREMARRMMQLDLVISVDTMVAHLAGALGLPSYLLLNRNADWRWQIASGTTPWYPTMRIFRVQRHWDDVVAAVGDTLTIAARDRRSIDCRASSG